MTSWITMHDLHMTTFDIGGNILEFFLFNYEEDYVKLFIVYKYKAHGSLTPHPFLQ